MDYNTYVSGAFDPDSGIGSVFIDKGAGIKAATEEDGLTLKGPYEALKAVWSCLDAEFGEAS